MNKNIMRTGAFLILAAAVFTGCKKDDDGPLPDEQELITTIKLKLTGPNGSSTYTYKVENGFNSTAPGTVIADTLKLAPNTTYATQIEVLNEKADPVDNTTDEILEEQTEHLFLYISDPAAGNGSVTFANGNKDTDGKPFNLTGTLTSGGAGNGKLSLYLIHQPTDKTATTVAGAGGETDVASFFPVRIQ